MPTSTELADLIADATGMPAATLITLVRALREAGHLETAGRGRGAARLGVEGAVRPLVACLAFDGMRDASVALRETYDLRFRTFGFRTANPTRRADFLPSVRALAPPGRHAFGDAVERVVEAVADGTAFLAVERCRRAVPGGRLADGMGSGPPADVVADKGAYDPGDAQPTAAGRLGELRVSAHLEGGRMTVHSAGLTFGVEGDWSIDLVYAAVRPALRRRYELPNSMVRRMSVGLGVMTTVVRGSGGAVVP